MDDQTQSLIDRVQQLEQELAAVQASAQHYQRFIENFPNGAVFQFDQALRYTMAQGAGLADVGLTPDKLIGKTIWEAFPEIAPILELHNRATLEGQSSSFEVPFAGRYFQIHTLPLRSETGEIIAGMAMTQDITAIKDADNALLRSQQQYEQLVNTVDSIVWEGDTQACVFSFVSQQAERLLGYPVERWLTEPYFWVNHIHPEDRDWVPAFCVQATAEKRAHEFEYRMLAADGRVVWLRDIVTVVVENDEPVMLRGVMIDITANKQAEAALKASEAELRAVFSAMKDVILVLDREGRYLKIAPTNPDTDYALPPQALIGKTLHDVFPPDRADEYLSNIRRALETGQTVKVEDRVEVDGRSVWSAFSFSPMLDDRVVLVARDITERKQVYDLLNQRVEERTRELSTLLHVSRQLTATLNLNTVLKQFLGYIRDVIAYDSASIFSLEGEMLQCRAYCGPMPEEQVLKLRYPAREGFDERIITTRQPLILADIHGEAPPAVEFRRLVGDEFDYWYGAIRSWMRVPLVVKDRVIGMLTLYHSQSNYFSTRQAELAQAFADQAAVAMENARLFDASQRRAEQFRVIGEMGYRIASILAVDELMRQIVHLIRESFGYYHIHIGLIEENHVIFNRSAGLWRDEGPCVRCEPFRQLVGRDGLSGLVAGSGEPILISDIRRDPRYVSLLPELTGSALVLPLKVKGKVIGVLEFESEEINAFDAGDVTVLQSFANQTAVAIENARLYEQSQQLAALEERQKLARELHDSVSQALYGIALGARTARTQLDRQPEKAVEPLDYVLSLSEAALAEMRALIFELRPESLELQGLTAALEKQAASLRARQHFDVQLALCGEPDTSLETKQALYRIAQEALHNIVKHAQASRVHILLQQLPEGLILDVRDDGRGFDVHETFPGHLGLQSMRERAEQLGAAFIVESGAGRGTHIRVSIPAS